MIGITAVALTATTAINTIAQAGVFSRLFLEQLITNAFQNQL